MQIEYSQPTNKSKNEILYNFPPNILVGWTGAIFYPNYNQFQGRKLHIKNSILTKLKIKIKVCNIDNAENYS